MSTPLSEREARERFAAALAAAQDVFDRAVAQANGDYLAAVHAAHNAELAASTRYRLTDGDGHFLTANYDHRRNVNVPFASLFPGMAYSFDSERAAVDWLGHVVSHDPTFSAFYPEPIPS